MGAFGNYLDDAVAERLFKRAKQAGVDEYGDPDPLKVTQNFDVLRTREQDRQAVAATASAPRPAPQEKPPVAITIAQAAPAQPTFDPQVNAPRPQPTPQVQAPAVTAPSAPAVQAAAAGDWFEQNDAPKVAGPDWFAENDEPLVEAPGALTRGVRSFGAAIGAPERMSDYIEGPVQAVTHPVESGKMLMEAQGQTVQDLLDKAYFEQREGSPLRALRYGAAALIPYFGPTVLGEAGDQAERGDFAGSFGTTAGAATMAALPSAQARANVAGGVRGAGRGLMRGARQTGRAVRHPIEATREALVKPSSIRAIVREAADLPDKAIMGAEDIFSAAAPTGGNPQFRANLYRAVGDLAEIGQKVETNLKAGRGGIVNPDLRVRATVQAIDEHLKGMYRAERAPQVAKHGWRPTKIAMGEDVAAGLKHMQRAGADDATRSLARKASAGELTLAEADQLARAVNKELVDLNSMTASERALKLGTNRRLNDLRAVDRTLKDSINRDLKRNGEVGVSEYESRAAALHEVKDQLQNRMNARELQKPGPVKAVIGPIARAVTGGKSGIASASQAAVADVNIGRVLERGFRQLKESGVKPNRGVASTAQKLLPQQASTPALPVADYVPGVTPGMPEVQYPVVPPEPLRPNISIDPFTRANRLGLLLPEQAGSPFELPPSGAMEGVTPRVGPSGRGATRRRR